MSGVNARGVLYIVVCAAPPAAEIERLVAMAQGAGWRVYVITTPMGRRFVDVERLATVTGEHVRTDYRMPNDPNELPLADAVVVAPATFNMVNKWAAGIADSFAVSLLCELMGFGVPIVAAPLLKEALARHVAFDASVETLRSMGVRVLFDPSAPPDARMPSWEDILEELHCLLDR